MAWLCACLLMGALMPAAAQIVVPDRLPDGRRMLALTTPAEWGTLAYDSLRTLPTDEGGRDTWWHRHALFLDGPVQVAMDPVLDVSSDRRMRQDGEEGPITEYGHRNVRGVRYSGSIDQRVRFGGKVLEMQRLLVAPETEYILAARKYPGMGPGKLRPADNGLYSLDHSLAEVWFDTQPKRWLRMQWGLGATQLGPGTRNVLWNGNRAPAPYLLLEADLGKGWTWRWVQSRQRGRERLPAEGAREGRYHPLGLGIRSLTKRIQGNAQRLDITFMSAQWTDVLQRGQDRLGILDWATALAPWHLPGSTSSASNRYLAAHVGLDLQWRRPRSTWYGQLRINPARMDRYAQAITAHQMDARQWMVGHVRHGERWTFWTEWAPVTPSAAESVAPLIPVSPLGIQPWSPWRPDFIQGGEIQIAGLVLSAEAARIPQTGDSELHSMTWKGTIALPSRAADTRRSRDKYGRFSPNRFWPPLVPLTPFFSAQYHPASSSTWLSMGISCPAMSVRKTH